LASGADLNKIMGTATEIALLHRQEEKELFDFYRTELIYRAVLLAGSDSAEATTSFNKLLSGYWDMMTPSRKKERSGFADQINKFDDMFKDKPIKIKNNE
jgi:hypothetical protein